MHADSDSNAVRNDGSGMMPDARDLFAVFDALPLFLNLLAADGRLLDGNKLARASFSLTEEEFARGLGKHLADTLPWRAAQAARARLRSAIASAAVGASRRFEAELPTGGGRTLTFAVAVAPALDDSGGVKHLIVSGSYLGERAARVEEAAQDGDSRLTFIYNNVADCIFLLGVEPDDCHRFLSINDSFVKVTGLAREQVIGRLIEEVLPETSHTLVIGKYREAIRENKIVRWEEVAVFPAGVRVGEVSVTPLRDEAGNCTQLLGVIHDITDRKEAEATLRTSEERLRLAVEAARMGVWDWNIPENRVEWAANLEAVFGLEPNSFGDTYEAVMEFAHPEDRHRVDAAVRRTLESGGDYEIEYRALLPGGEVRWMHTQGSVIRDEGGRPVRMLGINMDIMERKRAEQARREVEEMLASALRTSREGFILLRLRDELILDVNDGWLNLTGFTREDVIGKTAAEINAWAEPEDQERFAAAMREHRMVQDFEFTFRRKSGALRKASFSAEVVNLKGEPCALVIGRDITGRKRAEELLRASEERFRSYFELGLIGIAITLPTKGWVEVNDELLKILGYERGELFEKTWAELTHPDDLAADDAKFNRILRGEIDGYSMDKRFIRKDGKVVDATISTKCVRRSDGSIDYLVGLLQDITERKQAENQLKASREQLRNLTDRLHHAREEESTRIARELHDELGQALTAIIIDLSWLEEKWFDDEGDSGRQELLEKIRSATKLARSTTNTVRRIATELRPGLLDDFGIAAAIEWQAQEFQQRTGIRCEVDARLTHADLPAQLSTAVFRIFQEALTNVARHARASSVRVSLKDAGGCVGLEVKDDGRGVAEAELADARALGVTGIRERALLLGGEARIEGSPGEGTTVSVRIPLRPAAPHGSPAGEPLS